MMRIVFGVVRGIVFLFLLASFATAEDRPRATLGDSVEEPTWEQRLTISVGQELNTEHKIGPREAPPRWMC